MNPLNWFRKKNQIYIGLDIGNSKIRMIAAEEQASGKLQIIASCETPSAGIRKGEIIDEIMIKQCIKDLLHDTQQSANISISSTYLAVAGAHIKGKNNHGSYRLPEEDYIIDQQHIHHAQEKARGMDIGKTHFILNEHCGRFYIDRRETTRYPIGLAGRIIELNCHLITAEKAQLQQQIRIVRQIPLEIDDIIFAPLAAAQTALSYEQREEGALLIDLGGGNTNYICYSHGDIIASGSIAMGGQDINNTIISKRKEKISNQSIEKIKQKYGNAFGDTKDSNYVSHSDQLGLRSVGIEQGLLNEIISQHYSAIFSRIMEELGQLKALKSGMNIHLIGGGSLMRGVEELAGRMFELPIYERGIEGMGEDAARNDVCFCTALGLARYAQSRGEGESV